MKEIQTCSHPLVKFLIDDEDYDKVIKYTWSFSKSTGYVLTHINKKSVQIGRFLLSPSDSYWVDHRDGDPLNCQKDNLREATPSQNGANRKLGINSSGFKGVSYIKSRGKYQATIQVNGISINLGRFDFAIDAAKKYNVAALKHFGSFAVLNQI